MKQQINKCKCKQPNKHSSSTSISDGNNNFAPSSANSQTNIPVAHQGEHGINKKIKKEKEKKKQNAECRIIMQNAELEIQNAELYCRMQNYNAECKTSFAECRMQNYTVECRICCEQIRHMCKNVELVQNRTECNISTEQNKTENRMKK